MFFYCVVYGLALMGVSICWVKDPQWRTGLQNVFFLVLILFLVAFAGLRSPRIDRDYLNYLGWFSEISRGSLTGVDWLKDPAFVFLSYPFARIGASYAAVLTVIVAISLSAKLVFAKVSCNPRWLTVFFYLFVCRFFLAQEMTAIRSAAAIPLMSLSIVLAFRHKYKLALFLIALAITFHLSALVALPLLILMRSGVRFRSAWWILSLIPLGIGIFVSLHDLLDSIAEFSRFAPYLGDNPEVDIEPINLLSIYLLAHTVILLAVIWRLWSKLTDEQRMVTFCSALGLFFQLIFYSNNVLALRAAELFGVFDLLLFLIPLEYLKNTWTIAYAGLLVVLGASLFISTVRIMQPYDWIWASKGTSGITQYSGDHGVNGQLNRLPPPQAGRSIRCAVCAHESKPQFEIDLFA